MQTLLQRIEENLKQACTKAGFDISSEKVRLDRPKILEHGHFSSNLAMILGKKSGMNPRQAAEKIIAGLDLSLFEKTDIAGPGFINFWIEQKTGEVEAGTMAKDLEKYLEKATLNPGKGKTMVIDYSHPNIAKPMGVHHLLSTILGDSIKKTYKALGYKVIADNFIGDMGTQFGKLIHAIKKWGDMKEIEKDPINALLKLYVQYHFEADKDVEMDDEARAEYLKFEKGDKESRTLWEKIKTWSLMEIQPIYDKLGVTFDEMNGESFYEDKMESILERGKKDGVIIEGEKGAWIIPSDNSDEPPALVRKSDGATLYLTRDLARTAYWEKSWHPELMLIVTDVAQSFHFKQVFEAIRKLEITKAKNVHVSFGRMQFKDGAMSTRKGNIMRLTELLEEAEVRALKLVKEKAAATLSEAEQKELARILGIGSIKYNILHQNRIQNITFDWDTMLSFEGNSAPYLVYTATRIKSILRKAEISQKDVASYEMKLGDPKEVQVWLQLLSFPEALLRAGEEFKPSHLATYLYELAQAYNALYNDLPILQAEEADKKSRLLLTSLTLSVMEKGLGLLGLEIPEKM